MDSGKLHRINTKGIGRFDRIVGLTVVGLFTLAGLLIWHGDTVGVPIRATFPDRNAESVSAQTPIRVIFGQAMNTAETPEIILDPPARGETIWQGSTTLVFQPAQPLAAETEYTVNLGAGLESRQGRPVLKPISWQFKTRPSQILYLSWGEENYYQLFAISPENGGPRALTDRPDDVIDFSLSPDGTEIAYSSHRGDEGSDLFLIDSDGKNRRQILDCAQGACNNPTWEPNGRRLIYERRTFTTGAPGPPRLWWLDLSNGQTVPVFQDSQWLGSFARFSPDGRWLAYISPDNQEIQLYDQESGRSVRVPSSSGEPAAWAADGNSILFTEADFSSIQYSVYIYQVDVETTEVTQISGGNQVIDGWPTWSPDGEWIAFNRKPPASPTGKQLWMMRVADGEMVQLTSDPGLHHGPPSWSPDGRWLVFQQFAQAEPNAEPEIWMLNVETKEAKKLSAPGIQPVWMP